MRSSKIALGISLAASLAVSATALSGCSFYSFVSTSGDLGINGLKDTAVLAPLPDDNDASKSVPVVVLVHGFTASTYEMSTAATFLTQRGFIVSRPLLGAHGTTIDEFGKSTWKDWAKPIATEYSRLKTGGYKNVSFLTASTGGTLLMELYAEKGLDPLPTRISMVAPLLDFNDKLSGAAGLLKALGAKNSPSKAEGSSKGHWYSDRPIDTVVQLLDLTEVMKGRLRGASTGVGLKDDARVQIFQSRRDKTVDPLSAQLWVDGLKSGAVSLQLLDSDHHVPIGPDWEDDAKKNQWTAADRALRDRILEDVAAAHCPGTYTGGKCQ